MSEKKKTGFNDVDMCKSIELNNQGSLKWVEGGSGINNLKLAKQI